MLFFIIISFIYSLAPSSNCHLFSSLTSPPSKHFQEDLKPNNFNPSLFSQETPFFWKPHQVFNFFSEDAVYCMNSLLSNPQNFRAEVIRNHPEGVHPERAFVKVGSFVFRRLADWDSLFDQRIPVLGSLYISCRRFAGNLGYYSNRETDIIKLSGIRHPFLKVPLIVKVHYPYIYTAESEIDKLADMYECPYQWAHDPALFLSFLLALEELSNHDLLFDFNMAQESNFIFKVQKGLSTHVYIVATPKVTSYCQVGFITAIKHMLSNLAKSYPDFQALPYGIDRAMEPIYSDSVKFSMEFVRYILQDLIICDVFSDIYHNQLKHLLPLKQVKRIQLHLEFQSNPLFLKSLALPIQKDSLFEKEEEIEEEIEEEGLEVICELDTHLPVQNQSFEFYQIEMMS